MTDHPSATDYRNRAERAEQEAREAWACADRLATPGDDIPARVQHHADAILRASGSALRHYTMDGTRRAILSAVMDCFEEAYRAGADRAMALRAGEVG